LIIFVFVALLSLQLFFIHFVANVCEFACFYIVFTAREQQQHAAATSAAVMLSAHVEQK